MDSAPKGAGRGTRPGRAPAQRPAELPADTQGLGGRAQRLRDLRGTLSPLSGRRAASSHPKSSSCEVSPRAVGIRSHAFRLGPRQSSARRKRGAGRGEPRSRTDGARARRRWPGLRREGRPLGGALVSSHRRADPGRPLGFSNGAR